MSMALHSFYELIKILLFSISLCSCSVIQWHSWWWPLSPWFSMCHASILFSKRSFFKTWLRKFITLFFFCIIIVLIFLKSSSSFRYNIIFFLFLEIVNRCKSVTWGDIIVEEIVWHCYIFHSEVICMAT